MKHFPIIAIFFIVISLASCTPHYLVLNTGPEKINKFYRLVASKAKASQAENTGASQLRDEKIRVLTLMPYFKKGEQNVSSAILESQWDNVNTQLGRIPNTYILNQELAKRVTSMADFDSYGNPKVQELLDILERLPEFKENKIDLVVIPKFRSVPVDAGSTYLADIAIIQPTGPDKGYELYHGKSRLSIVKAGQIEAGLETAVEGALFPLLYNLDKLGIVINPKDWTNPLKWAKKLVGNLDL